MSKVENSFEDQTRRLSFTEKQLNIILETSKRNKKVVWGTVAVAMIALPMWSLVPLINWYTYEGNDIYQTEVNTTHWEFFCYRAWIPPQGYETPFYQMALGFQLIPVYLDTINYLSFFSVFFSLTSFAAAHFKVLTDIIRGVDEYIEQSNTEENQKESEDAITTNRSIKLYEEKKIKYKNDFSAKNQETAQISDETDYFVKCIKYHQAILE